MIAINGIFDGEKIVMLESAPTHNTCRVVVTFLDDADASLEETLTVEQYQRIRESLTQMENSETTTHDIIKEKVKNWPVR